MSRCRLWRSIRCGVHVMIATMRAARELNQSMSDASDAPGWRVRLKSAHWQLAIAFVGAFGLVGVLMEPWSLSHDFGFPFGTDAVWQQAMFQIHGQAGIFGTTHHLSWPVGANSWRLPQLGALIG